MIGELGAFLRYGLATDPLTDVDLCDEVAMQERYLALEQRRFAHRMTVHIDVKEGARRARFPSLILQPLVENAVKHGVSVTSAPTTITIRSFVHEGRVSNRRGRRCVARSEKVVATGWRGFRDRPRFQLIRINRLASPCLSLPPSRDASG